MSGTTDMDDTGTESAMAMQAPVTVAVASTTIAATITATTTTTTATVTTTTASATTASTTDTVTTETASSEVIDVSTTAMESVNHMSSTAGDVYGATMPSVPNSLGKNKDGLHQRYIEERKPDSNSNAHVQRSIQFGQQQQNQYHQQIQRRSKPRHKADRLRKVITYISFYTAQQYKKYIFVNIRNLKW